MGRLPETDPLRNQHAVLVNPTVRRKTGNQDSAHIFPEKEHRIYGMNSQISDMIVQFLIVHHAATAVLLAMSFWGSYLALDALKSFDDTLRNRGSARANLEGCVRPERSGAVNTTIVEQARGEPETKGQSAKD